MPHVTYHLGVNAPLQTIWNVLIDRIEHPERYQGGVKATPFIEGDEHYAIREIDLGEITIKEKITINEKEGEITYQLLEDPLFTGEVKNSLIPPAEDDKKATPVVQFTMDWHPLNNEAEALEVEQREELEESIHQAVQYVKDLAEHMAKSQA
jgi:hypothetical protein